jgi:putative ABC transport system permease protein
VATDLRFGLRGLRRNATFSIVAVATLGLGIGASATVFAVVEAVLLRPLPYHQPEQLVRLWDVGRQGRNAPIAAANLIDWQQRSTSFDQVAAIRWETHNLAGGDEPLRITVQHVSENFFQTLGAGTALGRAFTPDDGERGDARVTVLSHALWRAAFGGDREIVGRDIRLDEEPYTVIGVMPPDFFFHNPDGAEASIWVAGAIEAEARSNRRRHFLQAVARLRREVTVEKAQSEMTAIAAGLADEYPQTNRDPRSGTALDATVVPLRQDLVASVRPSMLVLVGAVGFVLLIAWVNVTNLLLARTTSRRRELALRVSIGAARKRIFQQLLTETLLLSLMGGTVGLLLARVLVMLFATAAPEAGGALGLSTGAIPLLSSAAVNAWVVVTTLLTCAVTVFACGLAPAAQATRGDPLEGLRPGTGTGRRPGLGGSVLVASEISLALVLLIGLGLLVSSMVSLSGIPLGFDPSDTQVMRAQLTRSRYAFLEQDMETTAGARWRLSPEYGTLITDVVGRLAELPGVQDVGAVNRMPLHGPFSTNLMAGVNVEGIDREPMAVLEGLPAHWTFVASATPDYFRAMGVPILRGRSFSEADDATAPPVAIVNEGFVQRYGMEDPVGKTIMIRDGPWREVTIVGVVGDVLWFGYYHRFLRDDWYDFSRVYLPYAQPATAYRRSGVDFLMTTNVVVRHSGDGAAVRRVMSDIFRAADPETPIVWVGSLDDYLNEGLSDRHFHLLVLGSLAAVALILASVGVYGVVAFQVGQRVPEIGVRMALGARSTNVVGMIVGEGARVAALGVLMGIAGAMATTRFLSQWLHGVSPTDPVVFVGLAGVMVGAAVLACWLPARRAAQVDPMTSLRAE